MEEPLRIPLSGETVEECATVELVELEAELVAAVAVLMNCQGGLPNVPGAEGAHSSMFMLLEIVKVDMVNCVIGDSVHQVEHAMKRLGIIHVITDAISLIGYSGTV